MRTSCTAGAFWSNMQWWANELHSEKLYYTVYIHYTIMVMGNILIEVHQTLLWFFDTYSCYSQCCQSFLPWCEPPTGRLSLYLWQVVKYIHIPPPPHKGVEFQTECIHCGQSTKGPQCLYCRRFSFNCSICHVAVKGNVLWFLWWLTVIHGSMQKREIWCCTGLYNATVGEVVAKKFR